LLHDVEFQWETKKTTDMAIVQNDLGNVLMLKLVDIGNDAGEIVIVVKVSLKRWGAILNRKDLEKDQHLCCDRGWPWKTAKNSYEQVKLECHGLIMALMMFHNYIYVVRFHVGTDANTFVQPLILPANILAAVHVICGITGIQLVHFDMKHIPGKLNKHHDALSVSVQGKAEHGQEVQDNIADRIEPSLQQILVEQDLNESVARE
jgi:hypothetical protein